MGKASNIIRQAANVMGVQSRNVLQQAGSEQLVPALRMTHDV